MIQLTLMRNELLVLASVKLELQTKEGNIMGLDTLTPEEWKACFPDEPITSQDPKRLSELLSANIASVCMSVSIKQVWPGIEALDDQHITGRIRYSIGRWYVDDLAISRMDDWGGSFDIALDRLTEPDWMTYMSGNPWLYDPTDFFDVLEAARKTVYPHQSPDWLDELMWQDVKGMLDNEMRPVFPSRMQGGNRIYQVNRMSTQEKEAFCVFLSNNTFSFSVGDP